MADFPPPDSDDENESGEDMEEESEEEEAVPLTHEEHKAVGTEFYKKKDYRAAIASYSSAIETFAAAAATEGADAKTGAVYYSNRSAAYLMLFNYGAALEDCVASLAMDPTNNKVINRKGKIHVVNGEFDEAEAAYQLVLSTDSTNAVAAVEVKAIPTLKNRVQLAKDCLKKFETNGMKIEGRQAVSQLDIVLGLCPQYKEAKLIRCLALSASGRTDEAYSQTTSLMRSGMTNSSELLFVRAKCLYNMSQLDDAVKHLRQLLQRDPDHKAAFAEVKRLREIQKSKEAADAAYKSRDFETAVQKYTEVIDQTVDNIMFRAKLYNNRATAHSNLRNHKECVDDCTKAIALDDSYTKAIMKRATTLMILGEPSDIEAAIRDYEKYAELVGDECHREIQQKIRAAKTQLKRAKRKDFYKILGVPKDANESEIKKAYRKSALKCHPDRHASSSEADKEKASDLFKDVNHAYEVLSDAKKKELYDSGVDENDLDDPNAGAHGHGGHGGMGGGGGIDPNVLFQMFMQQQGGGGGGGGGGMGGGGGGFHFG